MTSIALAAAQLLADDVDPWGMPVLRALLPLAGMTLIEQQAERARAAGVSRLLVLVDGVPPALAEACDRISARGLAVDLVRSGADVLRLASGHDRVMLVADGLIAGDQVWSAAFNARAPTIMVTDDVSITQGLERIDAHCRWAGLAVLPVGALAALESAPREWDPQLLLFRAAVQDSAARIAIDPALFVKGDMMVAETAEAVATLERRLLTTQSGEASGLGRRYFAGPLVRLFGGPLLGAQQSGSVARLMAPLAFAAAAAAFLAGQPWIAAGLGMAGILADEAARFVARFRAESAMWRRVGGLALPIQLLALMIGERGAMWGNGHWLGEGSFPLAILVGLAMTSRLFRPLADDALLWPMLLVSAVIGDWQAAFDWVALAALLLLAVQLADPSRFNLPWRRHDATKKA